MLSNNSNFDEENILMRLTLRDIARISQRHIDFNVINTMASVIITSCL